MKIRDTIFRIDPSRGRGKIYRRPKISEQAPSKGTEKNAKNQ